MYKRNYKTRKTSPQQLCASSSFKHSTVNGATGTVSVNGDGPATSAAIRTTPTGARRFKNRLGSPRGSKRKFIFADLDLSDVNQNLEAIKSTLPSFQLSSSLYTSFNASNANNTLDEVAVPQRADPNNNGVSTSKMEGINLSDLEDDMIESIEGVNNLAGKVKATDVTDYNDLLNDDDLEELLQDFPMEEMPPNHNSKNTNKQPEPSENENTFVTAFQTASGKAVTISNRYQNKGADLFERIDELFLKEVACLLWNHQNGQP